MSVSLNLHQVQPASDRPEDVAAATHVDLIANRIFLDPMFDGGYSDACGHHGGAHGLGASSGRGRGRDRRRRWTRSA